MIREKGNYSQVHDLLILLWGKGFGLVAPAQRVRIRGTFSLAMSTMTADALCNFCVRESQSVNSLRSPLPEGEESAGTGQLELTCSCTLLSSGVGWHNI